MYPHERERAVSRRDPPHPLLLLSPIPFALLCSSCLVRASETRQLLYRHRQAHPPLTVRPPHPSLFLITSRPFVIDPLPRPSPRTPHPWPRRRASPPQRRRPSRSRRRSRRRSASRSNRSAGQAPRRGREERRRGRARARRRARGRGRAREERRGVRLLNFTGRELRWTGLHSWRCTRR